MDGESKVYLCQKKELQIKKGKTRYSEFYGVRSETEVSI